MRRALVAALLPLLLLAGCGGQRPGPAISTSDDGYHGTRLDRGWTPSALPLRTDSGATLRLGESRTPLRLVFFGYTNCPDVCQVVMGTLASAVNRLDPADRKRVQVVFVTTDPARDTPSALRLYLDGYDKAFVGATSTLPRIIQVAASLKLAVEKGQKLPSGGYEVDHTAEVIGIQGGRARILWNPETTPPELSDDIHRLLKE